MNVDGDARKIVKVSLNEYLENRLKSSSNDDGNTGHHSLNDLSQNENAIVREQLEKEIREHCDCDAGEKMNELLNFLFDGVNDK
jgi:hypothetical protein